MKLFDELYKDIQGDLLKRIDETEQEIVKSYKVALESIQQDLAGLYRKYAKDGKLYWTEMNRYKRLQALEKNVKQTLGKYLKNVDTYIEKQTITVFKDSSYRHAWAIDQDAGFAFDWGRVPGDAVDSVVTFPLSKLADSKALATDRAVKVNKVRNEITLSLVRGESYNKMSKRISAVLGFDDNNQYTKKGAAYASMRIARTEGHRAAVEGQQVVYGKAESLGIELEYIWDAALDKRTRPEHGALDGQRRGEDGFFDTAVGKVAAPLQSGVASFDIQCRCRLRAQIPGYPPKMRYVRGDGKRPWISYGKWYKSVGTGRTLPGNFVYKSKTGGWIRKDSDREEPEDAQNLKTAKILADNGYRVQLLERSMEKGVKSADALIDGELWEFKTNQSGTYGSISRNLRKAGHQANKVVLVMSARVPSEIIDRAIRGRVKIKGNINEVVVIMNKDILWKKSRTEILR